MPALKLKNEWLPLIKEWSYLLFFSLMLASKGIGLDSGDRLYFLISGAALFCVMVKIVLTNYSKKELIFLFILGILGIVTYVNSGRLGVILTICTILGLKDMNLNKLFRIGMILFGITFIGTVTAAAVGIISNPLVVHEKAGIGEVIRWGMGYSTGNILHVSYFIWVVLIGYCKSIKKTFGIGVAICLMTGNLLVFFFSLSYTGVLVTTFYLLLNLYVVKRKRLCLVEKILCQLFLPLCLAASFVVPFLLSYPIGQKLSALLQARPAFSYYFLTNQPIRLFGGRMKDVPNFWVIMDNGYVYILMTFGIVLFCLLILAYILLIARTSGLAKQGKKEDLSKLAIILSFVLYGVMEQFISNSFMNVSLFFIGSLLFGEAKESADDTCYLSIPWNKGKLIAALAAGSFCCVIFFFTKTPAEYVDVSVDSLNQVGAQSAAVEIENIEGSKEFLGKTMSSFREIVETDDLILQALNETACENLVSVKEIQAALEFSYPQYVHRERVYHVFRIRLLELYYDIPRETYQKILNELIELAWKQAEELPIVSVSIYEELIQKSAGEDRIEHMEAADFMVEKSGNITGIEYVRSGLLAFLFGSMLGGLASILFSVIRMGRNHENSN